MNRTTLIIVIFIGLSGIIRCGDKPTVSASQTQKHLQEMTVTEETMKEVLDAFNRHDLDAIMEYFSDDCTFDFPRGPEPYGQRFIGKAQVREGLETAKDYWAEGIDMYRMEYVKEI